MPRQQGDRTREAKAEALPRDFEGLRSLILARRKALPKRIAQIAQYSLDNPDEPPPASPSPPACSLRR
jgi:hypothetical protein